MGIINEVTCVKWLAQCLTHAKHSIKLAAIILSTAAHCWKNSSNKASWFHFKFIMTNLKWVFNTAYSFTHYTHCFRSFLPSSRALPHLTLSFLIYDLASCIAGKIDTIRKRSPTTDHHPIHMFDSIYPALSPTLAVSIERCVTSTSCLLWIFRKPWINLSPLSLTSLSLEKRE